MNKADQALFDMRSSGGKACRDKHGRDFYVKLAKKSAIVRRGKTVDNSPKKDELSTCAS